MPQKLSGTTDKNRPSDRPRHRTLQSRTRPGGDPPALHEDADLHATEQAIARTGVSVADLMEFNALPDPERIEIGQVLRFDAAPGRRRPTE
jgi:hypothetical protein